MKELRGETLEAFVVVCLAGGRCEVVPSNQREKLPKTLKVGETHVF